MDNSYRFTTQQEAIDWLAQLREDWPKLTGARVIESHDPVNYKFVNGVLSPYREPEPEAA